MPFSEETVGGINPPSTVFYSEKGRPFKRFGNNIYTYNANGIRTSKTINGVTHTYTLDGTKILREVWGNNTLVPLYDNEDSVCGILYNNMPFYFLKNLQGDIVAIVNKDAETVARYTYDAWGMCAIVHIMEWGNFELHKNYGFMPLRTT